MDNAATEPWAVRAGWVSVGRGLVWRPDAWRTKAPPPVLQIMSRPTDDLQPLIDAIQAHVDHRRAANPTNIPEWLSLGRRGRLRRTDVCFLYADRSSQEYLRFWGEAEEPDHLTRKYADIHMSAVRSIWQVEGVVIPRKWGRYESELENGSRDYDLLEFLLRVFREVETPVGGFSRVWSLYGTGRPDPEYPPLPPIEQRSVVALDPDFRVGLVLAIEAWK